MLFNIAHFVYKVLSFLSKSYILEKCVPFFALESWGELSNNITDWKVIILFECSSWKQVATLVWATIDHTVGPLNDFVIIQKIS